LAIFDYLLSPVPMTMFWLDLDIINILFPLNFPVASFQLSHGHISVFQGDVSLGVGDAYLMLPMLLGFGDFIRNVPFIHYMPLVLWNFMGMSPAETECSQYLEALQDAIYRGTP
jgi:hypothetical protein